MKIWQTKTWTPLNIALLKWSSACFGAILGAYFHAFVRQYVWLFALLLVAFAIPPTIAYLRSD